MNVSRWLKWCKRVGEPPGAAAALVPPPLRWGLCVALALIFGASSAQAEFQISLNDSNLGPSYPGTYGTVDVKLTNSTTATVTLTSAFKNGGNIYLFDKLALNVNAASIGSTAGFSVSDISGSNSGTGFTTPTFTPTITATSSQGGLNGYGKFNFTVSTQSGFPSTVDSLTLTLHNTSGTWADASQVLTLNGSNGYYVAAHVFATAYPAVQSNNALTTGFASGNSGSTIPDVGAVPTPPSVVLLGVGGLSLAAFMVRSRRRLAAAA